MKKTDIAMIILIAGISAVVAYFATDFFVGDRIEEKVSVPTVNVITSDITDPDPKIFNEDAINPSIEVQINAPSN